ncbi:hypothetical protein BJQ94_07210 [Cryobacterium sp. SO2]|uniref:hypothetical protein n=1 Tax=Cryobacterium sp. SO2 TaxID=1897060 RepID=UPI00223E2C90|nr:hypothetical protein [Cryobacterium sp. SO2]WEO78811.1 hypothetical protein BJQ94_07210 [Cryobacterium sp. SO2]
MRICRRTYGRSTAVAALLIGAAALPGCAGVVGGSPAAVGESSTVDPLACGMTVEPGSAVLGEEVLISRPATEPGECATLAPGSTQTLELRSSTRGITVEQSVPVLIGNDGAFEARMRIPTGIRLGDAVITAIPPAELDCTATAAAEECILPRTYLAVGFDPDDLRPVRLTDTAADTPTLPADDLVDTPYALAGPGANELTLVLIGSSCPTRPADFVAGTSAGTLQIVSADEVPPGEDCDALAMHWTTVIEIPDGYAGFRSVTVDNVPAILLDP